MTLKIQPEIYPVPYPENLRASPSSSKEPNTEKKAQEEREKLQRKNESKRSASEKKEKSAHFNTEKPQKSSRSKGKPTSSKSGSVSSKILSLIVRMSGLGVPTAMTFLKNSVKSNQAMFKAVDAIFCLLQGAYKRLPLNYQTMEKDWKIMRSLIVPLLISTVLGNIRTHLKLNIPKESIENAKNALNDYRESMKSQGELVNFSSILQEKTESIVEYVDLAVQLWEFYHMEVSGQNQDEEFREIDSTVEKKNKKTKEQSSSISKNCEKASNQVQNDPTKSTPRILKESSQTPKTPEKRDHQKPQSSKGISTGSPAPLKLSDNPKQPSTALITPEKQNNGERTQRSSSQASDHRTHLTRKTPSPNRLLVQSPPSKNSFVPVSVSSHVLKFQQELVKLISFKALNSVRKTSRGSQQMISALSSLAFFLAGQDQNIPDSILQNEKLEWKFLQDAFKSSKVTESIKKLTISLMHNRVSEQNKLKALKEVRKYKEISKKLQEKALFGTQSDCECIIRFVEHCGELYEISKKSEESWRKPSRASLGSDQELQRQPSKKKNLSQTPEKNQRKTTSTALKSINTSKQVHPIQPVHAKKPESEKKPRSPKKPVSGMDYGGLSRYEGEKSKTIPKAKQPNLKISWDFGRKNSQAKSLSVKPPKTIDDVPSSSDKKKEKSFENVDYYVMQKLKSLNLEAAKKRATSLKTSFKSRPSNNDSTVLSQDLNRSFGKEKNRNSKICPVLESKKIPQLII